MDTVLPSEATLFSHFLGERVETPLGDLFALVDEDRQSLAARMRFFRRARQRCQEKSRLRETQHKIRTALAGMKFRVVTVALAPKEQ